MERTKYVVDWDGTCVDEQWPGMGDWLPGAVESLRTLADDGKTVIYSLRCSEYELDDVTLRPVGAAAREVREIRRMLDEAGLEDIEVFPNDRGKPHGKYYIDDRAVRFGSWYSTMSFIVGKESHERNDRNVQGQVL